MSNLLNQATILEKKAEDFGFSWENPKQILDQIESECKEIEEHIFEQSSEDRKATQEEIGDLLHAVLSLCVFCNFCPTETLSQSLDKFSKRLNAVQHLAITNGLSSLKGKSFSELMAYWNKAKELCAKD